MLVPHRSSVSRRIVLAALPVGALADAMREPARAQPAAADAMSFYLGQVLALATLQAAAIARLRPLLATPLPTDATWQSAAAAEAGIVAAVAAVLGAMEPPPELAGSVSELQLASAAYRAAADAARDAAGGDENALADAMAGLAQGAGHILLWLDMLTAETGNDWGDGLRTLTETPAPAAIDQAALDALIAAPPETDPGDG
jgi:hypothetical protein